MRVLLIHAEKFGYSVRERALKSAPEVPEDKRALTVDNVLVVFTTIEKFDNDSVEYLRKIAEDVLDVASKVKAENVLLYPYAHLSSELAPPDAAVRIFEKLETILKELGEKRGFKVYAAPFGYYKAFELKCIGHPLAELSRSYRPAEEKTPEETQPTIKNYYVIITPSGDVVRPEDYKFSEAERDFEILVRKEVFKQELPGGEEPRYLTYCKKFGIEWEPLSDIGHMRYGPEACIMFDLIEQYAWQVAKRLGIPLFKVRGTNMFRLSSPAVAEHAKLFGERMYMLETDAGTLVLRYAACFQQFSMVSSWVISYRDLPFAVLEIADSYRYEQPGETVLCFRVRKFTMPDTHIFTRDLDEAKQMCFKVHEIIFDEIHKVGLDYVSLYNVTRDFYENHLDFLKELAKREGKPILVNVIEGRRYYWVMNVEFHIVDELQRPREIATMQIDVGNAQRFNIVYRTPDGQTRHPVIIHTALIGSVERYLYAIFQRAALDEKSGKVPRLPTWLAPVQVRLIPVAKDFVEYCDKIADKLEEHRIRVDIDDREETVSKKIREAEKSWIPYIVVVGKEEVSTGKLAVRIRGEKSIAKMTIDELVAKIEEETRGYPKTDLYLPRRLSMRPQYKPTI